MGHAHREATAGYVVSGIRVEEARNEPLAEGLPPHLAAKFRSMSHEEVVDILTEQPEAK